MYYYSPFRKEYEGEKHDRCDFCTPAIWQKQAVRYKNNALVENEHYLWIINWYPRFEGHTMVIPKRHIVALGEESLTELAAREELCSIATHALTKLYQKSGFEIFLQVGKDSDRSLTHLHWHITPASLDDVFRGTDKMSKFCTTNENEQKIIMFPTEISLARENLREALKKVLT